MPDKHIPFERSFAPSSEDTLRDPDFLSQLEGIRSEHLHWKDLHESRCTVVLGEGKCGKTHEFKQQNQELKAAGTFSLFIPLELLQDNNLLEVITDDEEDQFERWLHRSDEEAVFFLDAVDELKLRNGFLRKALRKIKSEVGSQLHRLRFFISCRPNDWDNELDLDVVKSLIVPKQNKAETIEHPDGEKIFSEVIKRESFTPRSKEPDEKPSTDSVQVLHLIPLTHDETISFAQLYAPNQADALKAHLEEKELWHLYQLPADIISALDQLISQGRLGNLEEQLVFGIRQRLREVSSKKSCLLSEEKSLIGAERIALALFLMKRRSIYLKSSQKDIEGLSVADILSDWTSAEQTELLGKALFDPTGVDSVRFYHRSIQEFLAAQRLHKLRSAGLPTADIYNLLFADIGAEKVIIPSMEPIAAWMALWNIDILTEVKARNPLLLFRQGIPSSLSIELREQLLRKFVSQYAGSAWRRLGVGHPELRRVATPELAPVVRELWEQAYTGHDTRELLLELIYLTPMPSCCDLAFHASLDESLPIDHRTYASWAVLNCGTIEQKKAIGTYIMGGRWPERLVRGIIPDLLPEAISLDQFLTLAQTLQEAPNSVLGLGYALLQTMRSEVLSNYQQIILRDGLTDAVWRCRTTDSKVYQANSKYSHFVDAIIFSCGSTLPTNSEEISNWAWSMAIAFHFSEPQYNITTSDNTKKIEIVLSTHLKLREAYFCACLDLAEQLEGPENDWMRFCRAEYSLLNPLTENDFPWLLRALSPESRSERRGVVFYILSSFIARGSNPELAKQVADLIADRLDLIEELDRCLNPLPREPSELSLRRQRLAKENEQKEVKRVQDWERWRKKVLKSKDFLLDGTNCERTLFDLYEVLWAADKKNSISGWGHWDSGFVQRAFSSEFLKRVRKAFAQYWRKTSIQLYSERSEDARNSNPNRSLLALTATKCDAETSDWSLNLTHSEAVQATRIAMLELNGFASYLPLIEAHHPMAVKEVIEGEVQAQMSILLGAGKAPILHDILYHGTPYMQESAISGIIAQLPTINSLMSEETKNDIKYAYRLIAAQGGIDAVNSAIQMLSTCLGNNISSKNRIFWLQMLQPLDLEKTCNYVLQFTEELSTEAARDNAISVFAAAFGDHHRMEQPNFEELETATRLELLHKLVIRAYQTVSPQDDRIHESSYTPNTRDHAEHARGHLLQCLATTNSPGALAALYELAERSEFSHISDRLKQTATELAGRISESAAMNAETYRRLDQEQNYMPYDDRSLFTVMKNRISDLEHHLINDEQSTIDTLKKIDEETELRRFISYWLNQNSRGAYTVTQEAVVVSEKRTDIRLHLQNLDKYASIELKLDDSRHKWSGSQLKEALVVQLAGRYLNHERCQVGCLLICMRKPRRWENPDSGSLMDLKDTVTWLQGIAQNMMEQNPGLLISVKGIDYSVTANESDHSA